MVHPGIEKRVKPFPSAFVTVAFTRVLTRDAEPKLVHGLLPREMEDKWYVRLADGYLDFFRSWTGHHIYRIPVTVADAALTLGDLLVNNDTEQWNPSAIPDHTKIVNSLIDRTLAMDTAQDAQHGFYAKPRLRPWSIVWFADCLLYTSPSPRDKRQSRMPSSA